MLSHCFIYNFIYLITSFCSLYIYYSGPLCGILNMKQTNQKQKSLTGCCMELQLDLYPAQSGTHTIYSSYVDTVVNIYTCYYRSINMLTVYEFKRTIWSGF